MSKSEAPPPKQFEDTHTSSLPPRRRGRAAAQPGCRNQPNSSPRDGSARYKNRRRWWGAGVKPELGEARGSAASRPHVRQHHDRSIAVTSVMSVIGAAADSAGASCVARRIDRSKLSRGSLPVAEVARLIGTSPIIGAAAHSRRGIRTSVMSATAWLARMIKSGGGLPKCRIEAGMVLSGDPPAIRQAGDMPRRRARAHIADPDSPDQVRAKNVNPRAETRARDCHVIAGAGLAGAETRRINGLAPMINLRRDGEVDAFRRTLGCPSPGTAGRHPPRPAAPSDRQGFFWCGALLAGAREMRCGRLIPSAPAVNLQFPPGCFCSGFTAKPASLSAMQAKRTDGRSRSAGGGFDGFGHCRGGPGPAGRATPD
jgi:hypothetical protein